MSVRSFSLMRREGEREESVSDVGREPSSQPVFLIPPSSPPASPHISLLYSLSTLIYSLSLSSSKYIYILYILYYNPNLIK